eukprot:SAG22_NODE_14969_length_360_cov_1.088123_1_plen_27_part_10
MALDASDYLLGSAAAAAAAAAWAPMVV